MFAFSVLFGIFSVIFQMGKPEEAEASTTTENFNPGSFIVNMGITPQTNNNALKPYGLVYDLVKNYGVPVKWIINPAKVKDGTDFTYNSVNYKGSAFVIPAEFISSVIAGRISYWQGSGVSGTYTNSSLSVPVYATITSFPLVMIDSLSSNQEIIENYYSNAGIPSSAYSIGTPASLTECYDVWANPHGDPTWPTHYYLYDFVTVQKSWIWAQCHSVSMMEYCNNGTLQLNFLSSNGLKCWGSNKCGSNPETHTKSASSPYTYSFPTDPVMQFIGNAHEASKDGSEQWFQPLSSGQWNTNTKRGIRTGTGTAPKEGTVLVYGPAYNNTDNGWVMYQGGHDLNTGGSSASDRVAAQRAYFNFILLAGKSKQVNVTASIPGSMNVGQVSPVLASATSGTPPYTYQWTSSLGGVFGNPTDSSTTFTAPVVLSDTTDVVQVKVTDQCGRVNFYTHYIPIGSSPLPVEFLSFNGYKKDGIVYLNWTTGSEINNDYFSIERSSGGNKWMLIGKVRGSGNSSVALEYSFSDIEPLDESSYYRLSQTDYDGTSQGYRIIRIASSGNLSGRSSVLNINPNPFQQSFSFEFLSGAQQNAELSIFSIAGDLILKKNYPLYRGVNKLVFSDTEILSEGVYFITLKSESDKIVSGKIMKR